jgi:hypothetical protein
MADSAYQIQYRQEFIAGFEQGQSMLRAAVTTEAVIKGNQATFLVVDTGNAAAVTRGVNGLIPARPDNLNQYTATLQEWHDKPRRTNFNLFASQGDGRRIMQQGTTKVMNRKIDQDILGELANATNNLGGAATASLALVMKARAKLGRLEVETEDVENMFFVISPAFEAYLMQIVQFASSDYIEVKPFAGPAKKMIRWAGFNWIVHPRLTGIGTSSCSCYAFHRAAIGQAINTGDMEVKAGENEEDSYAWARTSMFMGSKLLQNNGVVKVLHDDSAYA